MPRIPVYVADFETTTDPEDCRVWSFAFVNIHDTEKVYTGLTVDDFMKRISNGRKIVYFHNLGFDGRFMLDHMLKNGYVHTQDDRKLRDKQFKTIISNMGKFYSITVNIAGSVIEFRDSYKKLTFSVSKIAKTFNLPIGKGDIDYHKPRPVGYEPTPEEWDYIERDVVIVALALRELEDNGMTKLTVASDSMAEYKRLISSKMFTRLFPVLNDRIDADIRRAYRGGFTYCDERYRLKSGLQGYTFDVNSLYPYVMRYKELPYAMPEFVSGEVTPTDEMPLFIATMTITATIKPHHIPCIQVKNNPHFSAVDYLKTIDEPTTISASNVDWELYHEHYDIVIHEYLGGYRFKSATGLFDDYIDKWSDIKARSEGGQREIAKLHLNSLYGKFATNPDITPKIPKIENDILKLKLGDPETRNPVYTAMGVFITAHARAHTIRAAQENYDSFAYADTDSLHLITDTVPSSLEIDPHALGKWKLEYRFIDALFIGPKKYMETAEDGYRHNHVAGVPVDAMSELAISDVFDGMVIPGKKHPVAVPGGVVLEEVDYTLTF